MTAPPQGSRTAIRIEDVFMGWVFGAECFSITISNSQQGISNVQGEDVGALLKICAETCLPAFVSASASVSLMIRTAQSMKRSWRSYSLSFVIGHSLLDIGYSPDDRASAREQNGEQGRR
jgi:hypothetical protein